MDNPRFVDDEDIPLIDEDYDDYLRYDTLIQAGLKRRCLLRTLNSQQSG